jgi:hypothetical protein
MTEDAGTPTFDIVEGERLPWSAPTLTRLGASLTAIACLPGPEGICTTSTTAS